MKHQLRLIEITKQTYRFIAEHKKTLLKFSILPGIVLILSLAITGIILQIETTHVLNETLLIVSLLVYLWSMTLFSIQVIQVTLNPKFQPPLIIWEKLHWRFLRYCLLLILFAFLPLNFFLLAAFSLALVAVINEDPKPLRKSWQLFKKAPFRLIFLYIILTLISLCAFISWKLLPIILLLDLISSVMYTLIYKKLNQGEPSATSL